MEKIYKLQGTIISKENFLTELNKMIYSVQETQTETNLIFDENLVKNQLREKRKYECFSIINRGNLWYSKLSNEQLNELDYWYNAWLNVTETNIIPQKPLWLK